MKILFLDIDGVLNSYRTATAFGGFPFKFDEPDRSKFDWVAVALIRKLCAETGAKIVVSSTWRLHFSVEEIAKGLDLPVIDRTVHLPGIRGLEINAWLQKHPDGWSMYAIVDDNSDMLPEQVTCFVQTNIEEGLTLDNYRSLYEILAGER